ncbi:hypothetical protein HAX54_052808 [Datura stramonium]|uniref:Uncharacterized protein n=1 Tax=Datura stramonium TaxID=4076 RepID=A0ABS8T030_DATST|nr:hypothetical protein [Datura stramonium]
MIHILNESARVKQCQVDQQVGQDSKIDSLTSTDARLATAGGHRCLASSNAGDLPMFPVHCVQAVLHRHFMGLHLCFVGEVAAHP